MRIHVFFLLTGFFLCVSFKPRENSFYVVNLTCEYLSQPLGIDRVNPILGWQLTSTHRGKSQSAYQILVASSLDKLNEKKADYWNSQKTASNKTANIKYKGRVLTSRAECFWKVRSWDEQGKPSAWSEPAKWTMGLLDSAAWNASWISSRYKDVSRDRSFFQSKGTPFDGGDSAATYLRKEVTLFKKLKQATVSITGLGYYELYINGKRIGDHVLDPVFTDYQKHVNYCTYNVTSNFIKGNNAIGVILGNGFYNLPTQDLFQMNRAHWKTPNKLLFNLFLEYEDGSTESVVSNKAWRWSTGAIVYNSIRGGETIDMNRHQAGWDRPGFNDSAWQPVVEVPKPLGRLVSQYMPPLRVTRTLKAMKLFEPKKGVYVFDFGENITGWASVKLQCVKGATITLNFNEVLNADSSLNVRHSAGHTWGRFQKGIFISAGGRNEVYEPRFLYHGFRYVQVEGLSYKPSLEDVVAKSVHTDLLHAGTFESSSTRLNQLQAAIIRTLLNSVHSMPGEEATREKMGWTLDAGMVTMETYLMNFDAINTYKKYLQDLIDAQEPNGHVPPIVPTNGWGFLENDTTIQYDDPWWGGTIVYVSNKLFEFTGDTAILSHAFEPMKKYVDFIASTSKDDLVYWSLGDWLDLKHGLKGWGPGLTPIVQTSTAAFYDMSNRLAMNAALLGKMKDAKLYNAQAQRIKEKYNSTFLDYKTGWYAENSQTAQAVPLYLNMVPEAVEEQVEKRLLEAIVGNNYHTSVGFIGINPLLKYLSDNGQLALVYKMVTQEQSPGWLHMVKDERSTMGENLNAQGYGTGHHPFSTNVGFWLYYFIGGIMPMVEHPGFDRFTLRPGFQTDIEWVNTSYQSLKGKIISNWKRKGEEIYYTISIPANSTAIVEIPSNNRIVSESGKPVSDIKFIQKMDSDKFLISSGNYNFLIR
jgi:alpha-L-rhamnosidase